jgi:IMP cyclohydrolase
VSKAKITPRYQAAIDELKTAIAARFPDVSFLVVRANDARGYDLFVYPEYSDPEEIAEHVRERMLRLILDENTPVYVVPTASKREIEARRAARS